MNAPPTPPPPPKKLMSIDEVASYTGRSRRMIWTWINDGKLASSQPGGKNSQHIIRVEDVDALLAPKVRTPPKGDGGAS